MNGVALGALALLGLVGSTHCLAMCGAFTLCLDRRSSRAAFFYQGARALSYVVLGALLGAFGAHLRAAWNETAGKAVLICAGGGMIALGLAQAGVLRLPALAGARPPRVLVRLLSARSDAAALGLGLLTGLLPCPLLYAALLRATVASSPLDGAAGMAAFFAGTLPMMAGVSALNAWLGRHGRRWWPRAALLVTLVLGCVTVYGAVAVGAGGTSGCSHCGH